MMLLLQGLVAFIASPVVLITALAVVALVIVVTKRKEQNV